MDAPHRPGALGQAERDLAERYSRAGVLEEVQLWLQRQGLLGRELRCCWIFSQRGDQRQSRNIHRQTTSTALFAERPNDHLPVHGLQHKKWAHVT